VAVPRGRIRITSFDTRHLEWPKTYPLFMLALIPFSDYPFSLFLAFSVTTLAFLWYRSSKSSGSRINHSTPHPNKGRPDAIQSVLKKPTTTSTTVATTYITPSAVTRADTAPIPPRNEEQQQSSMKEQCDTAWTCQPYDALLVLDVEATCLQGTDFHWPNEIIEWPVCLLKWADRGPNGMVGPLQKVAEFRSFVKPTWRPELSSFCVSLTGITQEQVDSAPLFPEVASQFSTFLVHHGLIHPVTGKRLLRFCWCTDGPFDIRDFVVKQCFISNIPMPSWIRGDVMNVRKVVSALSRFSKAYSSKPALPRRLSPNIESQLRFLGLGPFEGRKHSGIDDSRNIARIVIELARRGIRLVPNTPIQPGRRWPWMGKSGQVLEQYCLTPRR